MIEPMLVASNVETMTPFGFTLWILFCALVGVYIGNRS